VSTTRNGSFFTSRWARATCAETNRASERASSVCQALSSGLFSASYCRGLLLRATCTQTPSLCTKTTQKQKTARPRIRFVSHKADAKRFPSPIPTTTTCRGRPTLVSAQSLRKKSGQTHTHKKQNKQTNKHVFRSEWCFLVVCLSGGQGFICFLLVSLLPLPPPSPGAGRGGGDGKRDRAALPLDCRRLQTKRKKRQSHDAFSLPPEGALTQCALTIVDNKQQTNNKNTHTPLKASKT